MIDVVPVPERLEDPVGEAEDQEVLDRLLAEVVVDAVDLLLDEDVCRRSLSSRALARSRPNGFSMITRTKPRRPRHGPAALSCPTIARRAGWRAK